MKTAKGFENLEVWKRAARMSADLYKALSGLRDFGFRDQLTRSGLSVPSNIAEGMERRSNKDKQRFLDMALGSCGELRTQLFVGIEAGYLDREKAKVWINETREVSAMIVGLRESLTRN